ncbi:ribonuclease E inhibitor RraB [Mucilaginibacter sp. NFX135]|uniref:ribonuclease E inhibitor RraB n=1 Tax=Mucilaginibacter sp. NFX135 TaxID=3402687 RepID=UPI003AFAA839
MGLFSFLKKQSDKQFLSEDTFENSKAKQMSMAPLTMTELRKIEVKDDDYLKLEFFFYTNTDQKANALANELQKLNYEVGFGPSAADKKLFVITGWTTRMQMGDAVVVAWTKQMCELGNDFDCEFDGWGTTPDQ